MSKITYAFCPTQYGKPLKQDLVEGIVISLQKRKKKKKKNPTHILLSYISLTMKPYIYILSCAPRH